MLYNFPKYKQLEYYYYTEKNMIDIPYFVLPLFQMQPHELPHPKEGETLFLSISRYLKNIFQQKKNKKQIDYEIIPLMTEINLIIDPFR